MKITRYEWLFQNGETKGFFQGLDCISFNGHNSFDLKHTPGLSIPPYGTYRKYPHAKSYFTKRGLETFLHKIEFITNLIKELDIKGVELIKKEINVNSKNAIWKDKFQVII